jgi:hypothetical protein
MAAKIRALVAFIFVFSAHASNDSNLDLRIHDTIDVGKTSSKMELPGHEGTKDEAKLAAVHSHALAAGKSAFTDAFPWAFANDNITGFEKDVTELILGLSKSGFGATPMAASVKKIADILKKDMMPKVKAAHANTQNALKKLANDAADCGSAKKASLKEAVRFHIIYKKSSGLHKACRATEGNLYTETHEAWTKMKAKKLAKDAKCKIYAAVASKLGEQTTNKAVVSKGSAESVETYVRRITSTFCGKPGGKGNGGGGQGGFLDAFLSAKEACEKATKEYNAASHTFTDLDKRWRGQRKKCDNLQDQMDGAACKYATLVKDACEAYAECWKAKKTAFDALEKTVRVEETDRKAEWRGLKRMQCIITAFSDGRVTDDEVTDCKKAKYETKHLDIDSPNIPDMDKCLVPDAYPNTAAYKKAEFTPLPTLAKGKMDANQCTSLQEVSTTPAKGSPSSCKCERQTLNGPYEGAMVKCTKCIDIYRSKDQNSCPTGTKLFAPRSRSEWDTFIKSAEPLRAPNWIVDVTRPRNGCGGCTRHVMNSAVKAQSTWRTVDGSPWWLRSRGYNEPNGDYHANCYLDLWRNPSNADSVTFNDGSCSYHSKSYYCQTMKASMSPKAGSPSGCSCTEVQIASGSYTPGRLFKCTKCLKVHRSNDKNSCPVGTKIFSPQSRADWKAFLSSATALRDPHWIVDVTRPQNGCGGCTRHAMNKGNSAQATWRTADGSPWWLRSTRYNEPNGDYHANCYLDLWHVPSNEDSVTFNDGSCSYHSRSYYCQSVKGSAPVYTSTQPPWSKSQVSTRPKNGSPGDCRCQKLSLKGSYSAGAILKCTNCLEVKRASDKNSCPVGTKIFSPQSREDWKTFFASGGTKLRAPHWIVDVTRPQNGCGGCTRHAMNSGNSKQSTWRTSDGSPWWFRSNTYNEPNGDYTANCFLDLWSNPTPNNIVFNDGRCHYRSKSYYCQPKRNTR